MNSVSQNRLNGLALLHILGDLDVNRDNIFKRFDASEHRRTVLQCFCTSRVLRYILCSIFTLLQWQTASIVTVDQLLTRSKHGT